MEQIPKVQKTVDKLSSEIDNLENLLSPHIDKHISEKKFNNAKERAEFYTFLAYSLDSILFAYLKSQGQDTANHEIMRELERVKSYMTKVKQKGEKLEKEQRTTSVDKDAAQRIIKSALSGNKNESS